MCDYPPRYEHLAAVFWPLTCDTCHLHLVRCFTNLVEWLVMSTWRLSFRRLRAIHVMFDDTPLNQGTSVSFLLIFFQIFHYVSGHFGGVERDSSQNLPHLPGVQGE